MVLQKERQQLPHVTKVAVIIACCYRCVRQMARAPDDDTCVRMPFAVTLSSPADVLMTKEAF